MPSFDWGGDPNATYYTSDSGDFAYRDGIGMATGVLAANGNYPIRIEGVSADAVSNGYAAIYYQGVLTAGGTVFGSSGGTFQFRIIRSSGTMSFGVNTAGGGSWSYAVGGGGGSGHLPGVLAYSTVPTAPTIGAFVQDSPVEATIAWSTPSSNGGSAITGYRIQYASNPSFTGATTLDVGVVLSRKLTGLTPGVQYYVRVAALNAVSNGASTSSVFSGTVSVLLIADEGDLDGWEVFGTLPAGLTPLVGTGVRRGSVYPLGAGVTGLLREIQRTSSGSVTISTIGIQRVVDHLTIGATYRFSAIALALQPSLSADVYRLGVVTVGTGSTVTVGTSPVAIPEYEFVATATSHTLRIYMAENASWSGDGWFEAVAFYQIRLEEIPDPSPYRLCDTALDASLADHFTVACNTVGAAWWVDRENITRFRQATSQGEIVAIFTDARTPGSLEYVDLDESYDTRNTVNTLAVTNHTRDSGTGEAIDVDYAVSDTDSVGLWGVRSGSVEITLYVDPMDTTVLEQRLGEVLAAHSTPAPTVSSILWNAQENPTLAASLDVQSRIRVIHEGRTQDSRIVGITHTVDGETWMIRLELGD
jgi:hypothetical protein